MSEVKELLINSKIGFLKEWEQHESCYIVLAAEYDQAIAFLEDEQKPEPAGELVEHLRRLGPHLAVNHNDNSGQEVCEQAATRIAQLEKEKAKQAEEIKLMLQAAKATGKSFTYVDGTLMLVSPMSKP